MLSDRGFHVLRYNSRGVGRSTGRSTFGGIDEGKDLESVVQWGIQEVGEVETVVIIVSTQSSSAKDDAHKRVIDSEVSQGYSHGALIATLHPIALEQQHPHIKLAYVLLSYPLGPRSFLTLFKGSFYDQKLTDLISSGKSKILLAFGGRDEFTALDRYQLWVSDLEAKDSAAQSADEASNRQKTLRVLQVPEASHFWTGETNVLLRSELSQWLMSL